MSTSTDRRVFIKSLVAGGLVTACAPKAGRGPAPNKPPALKEAPVKAAAHKPATNIAGALNVPRTDMSLPGAHPGSVVEVHHPGCLVSNRPDAAQAGRMVERGLLALTGESNIDRAWRRFVGPGDVVGLKVNPVAGKLLTTSPAVVAAIIDQLTHAGIDRSRIIIWDRREFHLHDAGFTAKRFPGVAIRGTEHKDKDGSFYDKEGKLLGEGRVDKSVYYWADCEQTYDKETLPFMVNSGKKSFFSTIVTKDVTKIINIPVLKNAGSSVTLCLKNLAYGAITNTARLHKPLWGETSAQVPCFAPLRDKVVLNIVDGMIGCYDGGPGANPQFIVPYHTVLVGTDPVAVDRVGYELVLNKRLAEKVQKEPSPNALDFATMAAELGLGQAELSRITRQKVTVA